ncbi:MAG: hypothetical protein FWE45_02310 [Firmicutes bacterium]|nr:hypothetical protein [Bacillota bacterium]
MTTPQILSMIISAVLTGIICPIIMVFFKRWLDKRDKRIAEQSNNIQQSEDTIPLPAAQKKKKKPNKALRKAARARMSKNDRNDLIFAGTIIAVGIISCITIITFYIITASPDISIGLRTTASIISLISFFPLAGVVIIMHVAFIDTYDTRLNYFSIIFLTIAMLCNFSLVLSTFYQQFIFNTFVAIFFAIPLVLIACITVVASFVNLFRKLSDEIFYTIKPAVIILVIQILLLISLFLIHHFVIYPNF